jgi:hypothetical protein
MPDRNPPLFVVGSERPPETQGQHSAAMPGQQNDAVSQPAAALESALTETERALSDLMTIIGLSAAV